MLHERRYTPQSRFTKEARSQDFGLETEAQHNPTYSVGVVAVAVARGADTAEVVAGAGKRRTQPPILSRSIQFLDTRICVREKFGINYASIILHACATKDFAIGRNPYFILRCISEKN